MITLKITDLHGSSWGRQNIAHGGMLQIVDLDLLPVAGRHGSCGSSYFTEQMLVRQLFQIITM